MPIGVADWVERMDGEYLAEFIPRGGSAIKFVVGEDGTLDRLTADLRAASARRSMLFLSLDAGDVKLHMIHDLFFAFARMIEWDRISQALVERLFAENGYAWPRSGEAAAIGEVAEANGIAPNLLRNAFQQWITAAIWRDPRLTQDFRNAMIRLCLSRLEPTAEESGATLPVLDWLRGDLRSIAPLKPAGIFARIGRHNARAMLGSLCRWLIATGHRGLVVTLDIRQLGKPTREVTSGHRYTTAAVMDAFEVLRQVIDDIDRFEGLFLAALADDALIDGADPKRTFSSYTALSMRISNDVRAIGADNPLAPLVKLGRPSRRLISRPAAPSRRCAPASRTGPPCRSSGPASPRSKASSWRRCARRARPPTQRAFAPS